LSLSRGLVAAHHGTLDLDTASPHTRFVIRIPLTQPHA
jgi:signal transduction histidine kinase